MKMNSEFGNLFGLSRWICKQVFEKECLDLNWWVSCFVILGQFKVYKLFCR